DERPDVGVVGVGGGDLGDAGQALVVAAAVALAVADELVQQRQLGQADGGGDGPQVVAEALAEHVVLPGALVLVAGLGLAVHPSMRSWWSTSSSSGRGVMIAPPSRVVMVLTGPKLKQTRS